MRITKVAEGAYFVPSYSLQTIAGMHAGITNQGVSIREGGEDIEPSGIQEDEELAQLEESQLRSQ